MCDGDLTWSPGRHPKGAAVKSKGRSTETRANLVGMCLSCVGEIMHFQVLSSKHIDMSTSSVYKFFEV